MKSSSPSSDRSAKPSGSDPPVAREPVDLDRVLGQVGQIHRRGELRFASGERTDRPVNPLIVAFVRNAKGR